MSEQHRRNRTPRERVQAHLRRMMRAAGLVGAGVAATVPAACGPKSGDDSDNSGSATWDDPCYPDGCDPLPPTTTSDESDDDGTTTGTTGSTTWDDPCYPDGCDPLPPPTTSETTDADTTQGTDTQTDTGSFISASATDPTDTGTSDGETGGG